jgi:hypothetical protein
VCLYIIFMCSEDCRGRGCFIMMGCYACLYLDSVVGDSVVLCVVAVGLNCLGRDFEDDCFG